MKFFIKRCTEWRDVPVRRQGGGLAEGRVPDYGNKVDTTICIGCSPIFGHVGPPKSLQGHKARFYCYENGLRKRFNTLGAVD